MWSACRVMALCVDTVHKASIYTKWGPSQNWAAKVVTFSWDFIIMHSIIMLQLTKTLRQFIWIRLYDERLSRSPQSLRRMPFWSLPWPSQVTGTTVSFLLMNFWICYFSVSTLGKHILYVLNFSYGDDLFMNVYFLPQRLMVMMMMTMRYFLP